MYETIRFLIGLPFLLVGLLFLSIAFVIGVDFKPEEHRGPIDNDYPPRYRITD